MKLIFGLLFTIIITQICFSQHKLIEGELTNCHSDSSSIWDNKNFDLELSKIGKIELFALNHSWLTYKGKLYSANGNQAYSKLKGQYKAVKNFKLNRLGINSKHIIESIEVEDTLLRNQLFSILQPQFRSDTIRYGRSSLCYSPRNGIVFWNKEGNIHTIIELCFECGNYVIMPSKSRFSSFCEGTLSQLKSLFEMAGIKFGVLKLE
ncbi:MAG: hypothetical protein GQ574_26150 [Crocinitomix sp.]|nr:hypothetical protein [Crocinitomix sp.]